MQPEFEAEATGLELPKKHHRLRWLVISLAAVLGLVLAAYVGFSIYFMDHFVFNSTVNGVSVAFLTVEEVDQNLANEIARYSLEISARDNVRETINAQQIGLYYRDNGAISNALSRQNPWLWPLAYFTSDFADVRQVSVGFSEAQLAQAISGLAIMDAEQMRAPRDASLAFEGSEYIIMPCEEGTTLDIEKTTLAIIDAIKTGAAHLNLDELGLYERPEILNDDAALLADRDRFNKYVPFQITYIFGDAREILNGFTTINWVNTEGEAPYALSYDAVAAWVSDFAERHNTYGSTRTIVNGWGEVKHVTGGFYGWVMDEDAEIWAIMNTAEQCISDEREPYWLERGASFGANDWGTTYVEVDTTEQYMWYYVDGVCVFETDVITGNPNLNNETPEGVWYILYKAMHVVLRMPKPGGGWEYESPVTYWMPFTHTGCGFHDATWQYSFGGDAYLWRGSHGCVNMYYYDAEELYYMLDEGTPVIVHY